MSGRKITVIGSINMDLLTSTNQIPKVGETVLGNSFHTIPGGKGANQAVAA
jgi:ribokinase